MGEDGKVIYKVEIDDSGVQQAAEEAGEKAGDGVEKGAQKGAGLFKEAMIGAARAIGEAFVEMAAKAAQGVEQILQAGLDFNAKMEQYNTAFTTLLGSAEEAEKVMAQIRQDAASTPFDVDSLTQANQMLISAGISADQARDDILNLANAIAATGGGSAELSRMAANLQQIQNTGKATSMDIKQFAAAGINIYGLLADSMGVTTEEAAEMEITYEQLAEAFAKAASEGGAYENALEAQSQTFTGRISTLKDNATQLAGALTEDLFTQLSDSALPMVMEWVAQLLEAAQTNGLEGALSAAQSILETLITQFLDGLPGMVDAGMSLLVGLIDGLASAAPSMLEIAAKIIFILFDGLLRRAPDLISAGLHLIVGLGQGLVSAIPQLVRLIPSIIYSLVQTFIQNLPELLAAGIELLLALGQGLLQAIPQLLLMLPQIIMEIIRAFTEVDWSSLGQNIVQGIWDGIVRLWQGLVDAVRQGVLDLWNSAKAALGIASPSKKFKYIGEMTTEGAIEGIEDTEDEMTRTVHDVYEGIGDTAEDALRPVGMDFAGREDIERSVSVNMTATGSASDMTIVVPLNLDGREIARATAWQMGEQLAWEEL